MPFWLGFALVGALYATRGTGPTAEDPLWKLSFAGREWNLVTIAFILYGPVVDGPHLWATISRTYTDSEEWASRRRLLISSLLAFGVGPVLVLLPYVIRAILPTTQYSLTWGWSLWLFVLGNYANFHINKQHWGFVCLYKRKNGDCDSVTENRIDAWFFQTVIWLPYIALIAAPWDPSNAGSALWRSVFDVSRALFVTACLGYAIFQASQWRRGLVRNGPKLLYITTVLSLYYVTFTCHPRIAAFWIMITGVGHCAQYHAVVWAYGKKKYAGKDPADRRLPHVIFDNLGLYILLAVLFAFFTLQGPGANMVKHAAAGAMQTGFFSSVFTFLDRDMGIDLGFKICASVIGGVRLHHFYVDSKIWRVSKNAALAKNLSV